MESVVNYLEDAEKKLAKELSELFSKMREQRDSIALKGIEDMYSSTPLEGVLYEPCVRIPMSLGPRPGHYYWNDLALPKDEFVIYKHETTYQHQRDPPNYKCIALTSHGRWFNLNLVSEFRDFPTNSFLEYRGTYSPDANRPVKKLEPLLYKIPTSILKALKTGMAICNSGGDIKILSDTTTSLQELNKEFYLFAGKWKPHMTEHATLDIDKMRQTIIENADSIQDLSGKNKDLDMKNKTLQAELKELKEQKATLEKEKAKLLPLEKYKEAVLEFMNEHCAGNNYNTDPTIIELFKNFHANKVFMDEWVYNDVMESKEELNEYRIYKKVKGEMVSNGMDNSGVARNVRSIKTTIKKNNNNV